MVSGQYRSSPPCSLYIPVSLNRLNPPLPDQNLSYGIPTLRLDGNDLLAVHRATTLARNLSLTPPQKPVLIEALSYRQAHHSTSDDSFAYRNRVEVEDWKRRDAPISRLRKFMEQRGWWDEEREKEARGRIRREVLEAFRRAERELKPSVRRLWEDVYEGSGRGRGGEEAVWGMEAGLTEEQREQVRRMRELVERYPEEYDLSEHEGGVEGLKP